MDNLGKTEQCETATPPVTLLVETIMPTAVCHIAVFACAVVTAAVSATVQASRSQEDQCHVPVKCLSLHELQCPATDAETIIKAPFNFSLLFQSLVTIFLLCGECVILGAVLFGVMVHFTPGGGLDASKNSSLASLMAVLSAIGYHAVALGWYSGHLGVLHVVCFAPVFQALLTVAIAFLYAAVMDLYNHTDDNHSSSSHSQAFSPRDSTSQRHSHRRARWC